MPWVDLQLSLMGWTRRQDSALDYRSGSRE
jgi:hypothetical protein